VCTFCAGQAAHPRTCHVALLRSDLPHPINRAPLARRPAERAPSRAARDQTLQVPVLPVHARFQRARTASEMGSNPRCRGILGEPPRPSDGHDLARTSHQLAHCSHTQVRSIIGPEDFSNLDYRQKTHSTRRPELHRRLRSYHVRWAPMPRGPAVSDRCLVSRLDRSRGR
jgi:hypothetical protein